ncbi:ubiquitin-conjugating enzyme/RWD-like protein, partial [Hyaloraphidium curvatum]
RTLRINQEAATLSTSLPAPEPSSSIFLRVDDNSFDKWRFIITGPAEDTPYAYGCFLFDTSFGAGYPHEPPSVRILTTGKGTCRFNPNLYADGKVCLSLLNTWQGSPEEMWQPNKSTISQVLLSIQTFILVPQPYFNEPGYGPPNPKNPQSIAYNKVVRRNTVRLAMVDMLRNPPAGFEDVVRRHF